MNNLKVLFVVLFVLASVLFSYPEVGHASNKLENHAEPKNAQFKEASKEQMALNTEAQRDPLKETVVKSDLIVQGIIIDKKYDVVTVGQGERVGKFAYTIFTLSVEKVLKGAPTAREVFIRVEGGMIGNITQAPPIPAGWYFKINDRVLVTLVKQDDNVYNLVLPGVLWIKGSSAPIPRMGLKEIISNIIRIMRDNNITVTISEKEILQITD